MTTLSNATVPFDYEPPKAVIGTAGVALAIAVPMLGIGGYSAIHDWNMQRQQRDAWRDSLVAHQKLVDAPPLPALAVDDAARGRDLFVSACVACHGTDGKGLPYSGKDLTASNFVAHYTDAELVKYLEVGRPNTQPPMPAKAGRDDLTAEDLKHLVIYMRGLQDPRRLPALPPVKPIAIAKATEADIAAAKEAAGGDPELAKYIASGTKIFNSVCIACHGAKGIGIQGNGKPLVNNAFVQSLDDDKLLAFVKSGRGPSDAKNTTGIQMPPKGGNPALSDDDLLDVISYLRTLQPKNAAAGTK